MCSESKECTHLLVLPSKNLGRTSGTSLSNCRTNANGRRSSKNSEISLDPSAICSNSLLHKNFGNQCMEDQYSFSSLHSNDRNNTDRVENIIEK